MKIYQISYDTVRITALAPSIQSLYSMLTKKDKRYCMFKSGNKYKMKYRWGIPGDEYYEEDILISEINKSKQQIIQHEVH